MINPKKYGFFLTMRIKFSCLVRYFWVDFLFIIHIIKESSSVTGITRPMRKSRTAVNHLQFFNLLHIHTHHDLYLFRPILTPVYWQTKVNLENIMSYIKRILNLITYFILQLFNSLIELRLLSVEYPSNYIFLKLKRNII